jgi:hypothetical protein
MRGTFALQARLRFGRKKTSITAGTLCEMVAKLVEKYMKSMLIKKLKYGMIIK